MKFRLTNHFQERFAQRDVNFDHVKDAINNPDSKEIVFGGRIKVTKKIGNKTIEVVYYGEVSRGKQSKYLLLTVYYR